jgi:hypothetical protein
VVISARHRAGKAEPVDDDGSGPLGDDLEARFPGVAVQIDEDLDAVGGDAACCRDVVEMGERPEVLRGGLEVSVERIAGLGPAVIRMGLDLAAIVEREYLGHQVAYRVLAQIRRQVADAQRPRRRHRQPRPLRGDADVSFVVVASDGELQERVVCQRGR